MVSQRIYILYAITIFISSFLLFQVQPLLGKHLLPWFGGSSAVWIASLFFFMTALAVGYLYAQLLSLLTRGTQILIHFFFLILSLGVLYRHSLVWPSPITSELVHVPLLGYDPVLGIVSILVLSIGIPFVLLSSTSSLLQLWYGHATGREPFSLYAVSNAGSLLGLLSFPLIFERFFSTISLGDCCQLPPLSNQNNPSKML